MKNQQFARTALQKARDLQNTTSQKRLKERPPITPGKTQVTDRSEPYVHKIGRNHKLVGPRLGSFSVLEGPDIHDNYKLNLSPIMEVIHAWINRSHQRIYFRRDLKAFSGLPEPVSKKLVTIEASGRVE